MYSAEALVLWAKYNSFMAQKKYHKAAIALAEIEKLLNAAG